jgi:DNA (cytosine-5)-methyltransferase 3A
MIKLLIGGSPCTYWSIAQKNNRETEASGVGWELFKNYLIAKEKFKPDFFLYENNKSAAQPIKDQISKELGVDLMYINSALVSAQNRQRFYAFNWEVEQPEDRGIVLRDILESGENLSSNEKSYTLTTRCSGAIPEDTTRRHMTVAEPINVTEDGKSQTLKAQYQKNSIANFCGYTSTYGATGVAEPIRIGDIGSTAQTHLVYSCEDKSVTINANCSGHGGKTGLYVTPIEPMRVQEATKQGYVDIEAGDCVDLTFPNSKTRRGRSMKDKSNCLTTASSELYQYCGTVDKPIYEVKDGFITIKDKQHPIKLKDGYYIIRKLTPVECERLQTLPDGYTKAVSNAQRYHGLGNGWTAEVIIHILNGALKDVPRDEEIVVLSMYDGIGTGRYCLDKMGFTNVKYYAYEIDKYAKQVSMSNYPDIIQLGDAFDVRHDDWALPLDNTKLMCYNISD